MCAEEKKKNVEALEEFESDVGMWRRVIRKQLLNDCMSDFRNSVPCRYDRAGRFMYERALLKGSGVVFFSERTFTRTQLIKALLCTFIIGCIYIYYFE